MKSNFEWVKQLKDSKSGWFDRIHRAEELVSESDSIALAKLGFVSEVLAKQLCNIYDIEEATVSKMLKELRYTNLFQGKSKVVDQWSAFNRYRNQATHEEDGFSREEIVNHLQDFFEILYFVALSLNWVRGIRPRFDRSYYNKSFWKKLIKKSGSVEDFTDVLPEIVVTKEEEFNQKSTEEKKVYIKDIENRALSFHIKYAIKLDVDQESLISNIISNKQRRLWGFSGGPGTGKTTISIFTIKELLDQKQVNMFGEKPNILYVTYTKSLIRTTHEISDALGIKIGAESFINIDQLINRYNQTTYTINKGEDSLFKHFFKNHQLYSKLPKSFKDENYIWDELEWVIWGRNVKTLDEYKSEKIRQGRRLPMSKDKVRPIIWEIKENWEQECESKKRASFKQLAYLVNSQKLTPIYDYIFVDEAQDFTPVSLEFLTKLLRNNGKMIVGADKRQAIYSVGWGWQILQGELQDRRNINYLKTNYRMSESIFKAVNNFSDVFLEKDEELPANSKTVIAGSIPKLVFTEETKEIEKILEIINQWVEQGNPIESICILVKDDHGITKGVKEKYNCHYFKSSDYDPSFKGVCCLTIHASKGLQFKNAIVVDNHKSNLDEDIALKQLKLTMVGCSRAQENLALIVTGDHSVSFKSSLDLSLWDNEDV